MTCRICEKDYSGIIYEDDDIIISLAEKPVALGHLKIFPKKHYTIMEQVPDDEIKTLFNTANKISTLLFESLQAHGTNIIVRNGIPAGQELSHFSIDIIPRRQSDNINFEWKPKRASPEQLEAVKKKLSETTSDISIGKSTETREIVSKKEDNKQETIKEQNGEKNYLIEALKRTP
ncbi:HIT family protein [Candidatus Woesearchaeota archaeon]|nr:HIT family protein [Candidatus Woesearchaeota archaeon]